MKTSRVAVISVNGVNDNQLIKPTNVLEIDTTNETLTFQQENGKSIDFTTDKRFGYSFEVTESGEYPILYVDPEMWVSDVSFHIVMDTGVAHSYVKVEIIIVDSEIQSVDGNVYSSFSEDVSLNIRLHICDDNTGRWVLYARLEEGTSINFQAHTKLLADLAIEEIGGPIENGLDYNLVITKEETE